MIVEAQRPVLGQVVDVVIEPFNVLIELSKDWRVSIGVPANSPIMGGYWMKDESGKGLGPYTRIRLAEREEIVRFDAIKNVTELTATLYL